MDTTSKPATGLDKPLKASPELQAIVGQEMISRKDAVKALWVYIKANNLQDPEDKRTIVPDEKLKKVFGGEERVNMMSIKKRLSDHLSKVEGATPAAVVADEEDDALPMAS